LVLIVVTGTHVAMRARRVGAPIIYACVMAAGTSLALLALTYMLGSFFGFFFGMFSTPFLNLAMLVGGLWYLARNSSRQEHLLWRFEPAIFVLVWLASVCGFYVGFFRVMKTLPTP
jgi:hypothetical protein